MARTLDDLKLTNSTRAALAELSRRLKSRFPVESLVVFGSVARNEASADSDVDVLVLTTQPVSHRMLDAMGEVVFAVNLRFDPDHQISIVPISSADWAGPIGASSLRSNVDREGVPLG